MGKLRRRRHSCQHSGGRPVFRTSETVGGRTDRGRGQRLKPLSVPGQRRAELVPNLLTLSRFPMAGAIWIWPDQPLYVLALMGFAGLSDVLDGWFARRIRARYVATGLTPPNLAHSEALGTWLDPVADKTFVASVLVATWIVYDPPTWQIVSTFARELIQAPLVLLYIAIPSLKRRLHYDFTAAAVGKATTVAQFAALMAVMFGHFTAPWFTSIAGGLGVIAAITYFRRVKPRT
ncbi:MAG: CDP-alcohol phosphatidyltransferase family protein [Myxococcota bacterium]